MPGRTETFVRAALMAGALTGASLTPLAASDIATSAEDVQPLLIGAAVPEITLHTVEGKSVAVREVLAEKPTLLIFYRGGW